MRVAVVLLLASCGRIGFDPLGAAMPIDSATDTGSGGEPTVMRACHTNPAYTTRLGLTSRYREALAMVTWSAARADCVADEADLWIPDDALEIMTLPRDWVGLTDAANEGVWLTVKGTPATYLPWNVVQPDGGTGENCARSDGQLEDRNCADLRDYVCECE